MIFKTDLICITTLCIFSAFCKGKSSSESILVFVCLWYKTSEILLFNITRYLILSKILSCFSSEWTDPRYLALSYFLLCPSTLSKIILKSLWIVCSFLCKMINQEVFVWFFLPIIFFIEIQIIKIGYFIEIIIYSIFIIIIFLYLISISIFIFLVW